MGLFAEWKFLGNYAKLLEVFPRKLKIKKDFQRVTKK